MRFIITLITSLILLIPASGQGQWEIVEVEIDLIPGLEAVEEEIDLIPGFGANELVPIDGLVDVQFIDRDIGFFIGGRYEKRHVSPYGVLYKTKDGGRTWNRIYENRDVALLNIHFINESQGFMIGRYYRRGLGGLFTSSDGGYSWSMDTTIGPVSEIFFLNDSTGWAGGGDRIYKSIDGGENWNEDSEISNHYEINSLFFIDKESGWAVGTSTFGGSDLEAFKNLTQKYTEEDGWVSVITGTDLPLNKVFFADRDNGWISGGYSYDDSFNPIFLRTVDDGENWTQNTDMNYLINDFYFENKDHGWAVGVGIGGFILETFNGGLDWDVVKDSLSSGLNALHFIDGIGWAVGDHGLILTNDSTITGDLIIPGDSTATGIKEDNKINSGNEPLFQNYPNPFQSTTTISYQLPATSYVELSIYDLSGRKVTTLVNERQLVDRYVVEWNAEGVESGIYFCELKTGIGKRVMKMSIVR